MASSTEIEIQYRLHSIRVTGFRYLEPDWGEQGPSDINFVFRWRPLFHKDQDHIDIECFLIGALEIGKKVVFDLQTRYSFEVIDLKRLAIADDQIQVPDAMLITFLSLAYSTNRGILFERLAGTAASGIVLPVIDPVVMFEQTRIEDPSAQRIEKESAISTENKKRPARKRR